MLNTKVEELINCYSTYAKTLSPEDLSKRLAELNASENDQHLAEVIIVNSAFLCVLQNTMNPKCQIAQA